MRKWPLYFHISRLRVNLTKMVKIWLNRYIANLLSCEFHEVSRWKTSVINIPRVIRFDGIYTISILRVINRIIYSNGRLAINVFTTAAQSANIGSPSSSNSLASLATSGRCGEVISWKRASSTKEFFIASLNAGVCRMRMPTCIFSDLHFHIFDDIRHFKWEGQV